MKNLAKNLSAAALFSLATGASVGLSSLIYGTMAHADAILAGVVAFTAMRLVVELAWPK